MDLNITKSLPINIPMSDSDIKKYVPAMRYNNFNGKLPSIILYAPDEMPNMGHWCMLHNTVDNDGNKVIEFFDSYGMKPDKALKILQNNYNPKIVKWLLNTCKNITYSADKLQGSGNNIMTCGRHCIVREMFKKYSAENYAKSLKKVSKELGVTPDEIVSIIVP